MEDAMSEQVAFECNNCQNQTLAPQNAAAPECCGQPMQTISMDQCTQATTAEHSRFDSDDEPCDDGRAG